MLRQAKLLRLKLWNAYTENIKNFLRTKITAMFELFELQFMQRALVAGVSTGFALSIIGVFVVLRRSAFFGDAVAHFAFLGIALGFLISMNPIATAVGVSLLLAIGIGYIQRRVSIQSLDTIIGIFFSGAAALGIFTIGLLEGYRVDLFQFLFGDIISVSWTDAFFSVLIAFAVFIIFMITWKPLFRITFNKEVAAVAGGRGEYYEYIFLAMLALVTAVSIKIIGIILVPALLVIPAAAAKNVSQSFKQMIVFSIIFGVLSVLIGLIGSFYFNTASGATIVLTAILFFFITALIQVRK